MERAVIVRERLIVGLVSSAHLVSHFYLLLLIPLLPLLKERFGVSYVELGLALTVSSAVGAFAQTPVGFLVDRYGPRRLLIAALLVGGVAYGSIGFIMSYPWLLVATAVAGVANAAYHPADYDILSAAIAPGRVGRAFSYHTFSGYVGSSMAPPMMVGLATHFGLGIALLAGGCVGVATAVVLTFAPLLDARSSAAARSAGGMAPVPLRAILSPAIVGLTVFFAFLSLSASALQNFSGIALIKLYHIPLAFATAGLTAYLIGTAAGVLSGGIVADLTRRHGQVAAVGFSLTAVCTFVLATFYFGPFALVGILAAAGFTTGLIMPSRDMLVRNAAPAGAVGRTFGVVTTGFNVGGTVGPMIYGWLLDRNQPRDLFYTALCFMLVAIAMPLVTEWRAHSKAGATATAAS